MRLALLVREVGLSNYPKLKMVCRFNLQKRRVMILFMPTHYIIDDYKGKSNLTFHIERLGQWEARACSVFPYTLLRVLPSGSYVP
jgi:hypothetical protein